MARTSDRVMEMVRREVAKDPGVRSAQLYEQAKKLDRSISSLTLRQFHARYPLQVKRSLKTGARKTRKKATGAGRRTTVRRGTKAAGRKRAAATKGTAVKKRRGRPAKRGRPAGTKRVARRGRPAAVASDRGSVRSVLLEFAGEIANAENKVDMISVVAGMDYWVDRVVRAAG